MGRPHGLAGEVYVVRISDDPDRFVPGARLIHDDGRDLVVEESHEHGGRLLIKFEGISTRDDAATLRGPLFVRSEERRHLDESEFWEQDVIGCVVLDTQGNEHGTVREVMPGAAQDLLVIDSAAGERLVPMVKEIVIDIDVAARKIVIDPPEGLLD